MRKFINPANVITSCGIGAGFLAVLLTGDGALRGAMIAVAVAGILDAVDGCVARRARTCGTFGSQLDSLADVIAFGVAPALMVHKVSLHSMPVLGTGACLIFVVAGAWRLARFAVVQNDEHFVGLPIPPAGLIIAAAAALAVPAVAVLGLCVALALLMVSSMPIPTLVTIGSLMRWRPQRLPQRLPHPPPFRSRARRRARRPARVSRLRQRRARPRVRR